mgnify:CR=1 FL=1
MIVKFFLFADAAVIGEEVNDRRLLLVRTLRASWILLMTSDSSPDHSAPAIFGSTEAQEELEGREVLVQQRASLGLVSLYETCPN